MRPRPVGLGNVSSALETRCDTTSFNEAEARGPRKCTDGLHPRAGGVQASMRPRPVGLGNVCWHSPWPTDTGSFNEAEARGPRKCWLLYVARINCHRLQ